jgi:hypothetical protein
MADHLRRTLLLDSELNKQTNQEDSMILQCMEAAGWNEVPTEFITTYNPPKVEFYHIVRNPANDEYNTAVYIHEIIENGTNYLIFSQTPIQLVNKPLPAGYQRFSNTVNQTNGNIRMDVKMGIVIVPPQAQAGGKTRKTLKPKSKTRTDSMLTYKKHTYRVYQGSRGGLYIKVKGEWKSVSKDSLTTIK